MGREEDEMRVVIGWGQMRQGLMYRVAGSELGPAVKKSDNGEFLAGQICVSERPHVAACGQLPEGRGRSREVTVGLFLQQ